MELYAGTSGYSYTAWKGAFYPAALRSADMLPYYAARFHAVEINNTFYRMPGAAQLEAWAACVPPAFRFALKAPQRITHALRLREAGDAAAHLFEVAAVLKDQLGPVLFQLPPNLRKDVPRLRRFLELLPPNSRCAFEFRHVSWFDDETLALLQEHAAALCIADTDDGRAPVAATADWGYLRLRRTDYGDADLSAWVSTIRAQRWREAFVFLKHEEAARGPQLAARLVALWNASATVAAA